MRLFEKFIVIYQRIQDGFRLKISVLRKAGGRSFGRTEQFNGDWYKRRKIRLIESNAKLRQLNNLPVKGVCGRCLSA